MLFVRDEDVTEAIAAMHRASFALERAGRAEESEAAGTAAHRLERAVAFGKDHVVTGGGDVFMTPDAAASYLGVTPYTLQRMRSNNEGPRFLRRNKRALWYRRSDLDRFIASFQADGGGVTA